MSHAADQADELAALEAIYGDSFTNAGGGFFSVAVTPSLGDGGARAWVSAALRVRFTPQYPDDPPELALDDVVGLTEAQAAELRGVMLGAALDAAGTPLVYAVAEACREWLTARNEKPSDGSAFDEMVRRARARDAPAPPVGAFSREDDPSIKSRVVVSAAEEEDSVARRKRDGTPVTPESFAAWRARFDAENAEREREEDERCVSARRGAARRARARGGQAARGTLPALPVLLTPPTTPHHRSPPRSRSNAAAGIVGRRVVARGALTGRQLFESGSLKEDAAAAAADEEDVDVRRVRSEAAAGAAAAAGGGGGGGDSDDDSDSDYEGGSDEDDDDDDDEDD